MALMAPFDYRPGAVADAARRDGRRAGEDGDALLWVLMSSPRELIRSYFALAHMQGMMAWMGVQAGTPPTSRPRRSR